MSIADGAVVLTAIQSQANVVRDGRSYQRTADGSSIGSLLIGGGEESLPDAGESLTVPGVARLTPQLVERDARSIAVVGLRIRLLEGAEVTEVLDVARSTAGIAAS